MLGLRDAGGRLRVVGRCPCSHPQPGGMTVVVPVPPPCCGSACPSFGPGALMGAPRTIRAPAPTLGAPDAWVPGADGTFLQVAGEQKYHPECFSCLNCRTFIGDGDTYALVERSMRLD